VTAPGAAARGVALLFAAGLFGCASVGVVLPQNHILEAVHFRGSPSRPVVALTFDDGPNGACTAAVLDALAETGAPATFFVLGRNVAAGGNDGLLARMVHEGHGIGLHGWRHEGPQFIHWWVLRDELRRAAAEVRSSQRRAGVTDPPGLRLFRPPFGFLTSDTARAASDEGYAVVLWTVSVGDWRRGRSADDIAADILARSGPGAVIVLHDGNQTNQISRERCRDRTVQADVVRLLVPRLRERGLEVAGLEDVLGLAEPATAGAAVSALPPRR
jgi:peptidoglycan/xylan/chitin deacetylase (PgdA/CDA1 family)